MKVAVTYENGEVFQHFGKTPQFMVYEIENGEVRSSQVIIQRWQCGFLRIISGQSGFMKNVAFVLMDEKKK